jgi:hypothetical protein
MFGRHVVASVGSARGASPQNEGQIYFEQRERNYEKANFIRIDIEHGRCICAVHRSGAGRDSLNVTADPRTDRPHSALQQALPSGKDRHVDSHPPYRRLDIS